MSIESLIAQLESDESWSEPVYDSIVISHVQYSIDHVVAEEAADALAELGAKVVGPLLEAIDGGAHGARRYAGRIVARMDLAERVAIGRAQRARLGQFVSGAAGKLLGDASLGEGGERWERLFERVDSPSNGAAEREALERLRDHPQPEVAAERLVSMWLDRGRTYRQMVSVLRGYGPVLSEERVRQIIKRVDPGARGWLRWVRLVLTYGEAASPVGETLAAVVLGELEMRDPSEKYEVAMLLAELGPRGDAARARFPALFIDAGPSVQRGIVTAYGDRLEPLVEAVLPELQHRLGEVNRDSTDEGAFATLFAISALGPAAVSLEDEVRGFTHGNGRMGKTARMTLKAIGCA